MSTKWKRSSLLSRVKGVSHGSNKFFFDETNLDNEVHMFLDTMVLKFDDENWTLEKRDEGQREEDVSKEVQKLRMEKMVLLEMLSRARAQISLLTGQQAKNP